MSRKEEWENNEELNIFREYLRIPSVHPDVDYSKCAKDSANLCYILMSLEQVINVSNLKRL